MARIISPPGPTASARSVHPSKLAEGHRDSSPAACCLVGFSVADSPMVQLFGVQSAHANSLEAGSLQMERSQMGDHTRFVL